MSSPPCDRPCVPPVGYVRRVRNPELVKRSANTEKFRKLSSATNGFYLGEWDREDLIPMCGGLHRWAVTSKSCRDAARFAVSCYNQSHGTDLEFKKLMRVNGLSTMSDRFLLTLQASDECFYEAEVVCNPKEEHELRMMRPAKHYPTISSDLLHLVGPDSSGESSSESNASESTPEFYDDADVFGEDGEKYPMWASA